MTSHSRAQAVGRGASMLDSKHEAGMGLSELKQGLLAIKGHLTLVVALSVLLGLYFGKGALIALIDHQISEITVQGELRQLDQHTISSKVTPWLESSFLTADLELIKSEVESLAWVEQSTVSRVWPGKILISATEQRPVAIWNGDSYLNANAEKFAPEQLTWNATLPQLIGPEGSSQMIKQDMLQALASLQVELAEHGLAMTTLELKARGVWELTLSEGIVVALGVPPFEEKIERMAAVLDGAVEETRKRMELIDTRYPNGLAIKWKDPVAGDHQ